MAEDKFEQAVIQKLASEGWDYLPAYSGVTVDKLYPSTPFDKFPDFHQVASYLEVMSQPRQGQRLHSSSQNSFCLRYAICHVPS